MSSLHCISLYSSISSSARSSSRSCYLRLDGLLGVRAKNGHVVWHNGASFQIHCHQVFICSIPKTLGAIIARINFFFLQFDMSLSFIYCMEHLLSSACQAENADEWSYQKGLQGGWIPQDPTNRLYPGICSS